MPRLDEHARGVFPISATPFTDNAEIDWESADRLTDSICSAACTA